MSMGEPKVWCECVGLYLVPSACKSCEPAPADEAALTPVKAGQASQQGEGGGEDAPASLADTHSTGNVGGSAGRSHSGFGLPTGSPASVPVDTHSEPGNGLEPVPATTNGGSDDRSASAHFEAVNPGRRQCLDDDTRKDAHHALEVGHRPAQLAGEPVHSNAPEEDQTNDLNTGKTGEGHMASPAPSGIAPANHNFTRISVLGEVR